MKLKLDEDFTFISPSWSAVTNHFEFGEKSTAVKSALWAPLIILTTLRQWMSTMPIEPVPTQTANSELLLFIHNRSTGEGTFNSASSLVSLKFQNRIEPFCPADICKRTYNEVCQFPSEYCKSMAVDSY